VCVCIHIVIETLSQWWHQRTCLYMQKFGPRTHNSLYGIKKLYLKLYMHLVTLRSRLPHIKKIIRLCSSYKNELKLGTILATVTWESNYMEFVASSSGINTEVNSSLKKYLEHMKIRAVIFYCPLSIHILPHLCYVASKLL